MKYKFEDIAINSTTKKLPSPSDNEHYIGLEHLDSGNLYVTRWGAETAPIGEKLLMKKGDVLFGKRRAYQKKVGIAPFDGIFSAHGMVLRPKENVICKEFFPFFISSDYFLNEAIRISVGGLSPTINWKDLRILEFELPSLEEQKVLAEKLWAAYEVKESYKNLLAQTDKLLHAQFYKMFGDAFSQSTTDKRVKLQELCTLNPRRIHTYSPNLEVSFFPMEEVQEDGRYTRFPTRPYNEVSKGFTFAEDGDVLFAKITPCMENCKGTILRCLSNHVGFGSTEFHVLRPQENVSTSEWLYVLTSLPQFRAEAAKMMSGTGGQKRVPLSFLADFLVDIPDMEQQKYFAAIFHQAEKTKEMLRNGIAAIEAVIRSLIAEGTTKI